jgi:hypothetical protein
MPIYTRRTILTRCPGAPKAERCAVVPQALGARTPGNLSKARQNNEPENRQRTRSKWSQNRARTSTARTCLTCLSVLRDISEQRLSLTPNGNVRYQLKTPYRNGTTHVIFEPLDFIARLAALVPKPRVNLTRFHGVFAPNSSYRARVTPARRGRGSQHTGRTDREEQPTPAERRAAMTWAQRLKRVFGIDIQTCPACGGAVRIIACIEDPEVIEKILAHLDKKTTESPGWPPPCRAPPQRGLFDSPG